ncbi:single-stranded DNA-binding protein [bacterium]|nr:single-stranded DNA-binding protein [bacterium]
MLNKVMLIGRLVADPEVRFTPTGKQTSNFRIAVDRNYKQNNEWKKDTLFVRVVTWEALAKRVSDFMKKGNLIFVEGRLQIQASEKNGQKTWFTDIIANSVILLEKKTVTVDTSVSQPTGEMAEMPSIPSDGMEEYDFVPEEIEEI